MTDEQLIFHASVAVSEAELLIQKAWAAKTLSAPNCTKLTKQLRGALCAAVELENRANGNKPPKVGD